MGAETDGFAVLRGDEAMTFLIGTVQDLPPICSMASKDQCISQ
jgi:hypothetical protein